MRRLCIIDVNSTLNIWQNSSVKLFGPGIFQRQIFNYESISLIVIKVFKWFISYWVSCGSSYFFLKKWSISSKLSNLYVWSCQRTSFLFHWLFFSSILLASAFHYFLPCAGFGFILALIFLVFEMGVYWFESFENSL